MAIVGDILHSRVARSQIHALNLLNTAEVRVIAPRTLMPVAVESLGVSVFDDLEKVSSRASGDGMFPHCA